MICLKSAVYFSPYSLKWFKQIGEMISVYNGQMVLIYARYGCTAFNAEQPNWKNIRKQFVAYLLKKLQKQQSNDDADMESVYSAASTSATTTLTTTTSTASTGPRPLDETAWQEFKLKYTKMVLEGRMFHIPEVGKLEEKVYEVGCSYQNEK